MKIKARRYFFYLAKFIKSNNKKEVVKQLFNEVNDKGIIQGVQSLLHKKAHGDNNIGVDFFGTAELLIKDDNQKIRINLPVNINPKISIIIPMYNQLDYTYNCIYSICKNNEFNDYEIIIADDNSTEDTNVLKENIENVIFIRNDKNLGFLKNCNQAATKAKGEYIVFLNNDTQVQPNWLSELLYIFENSKDAGVVGSKLVYPNGRLQEAGGVIWADGSAINYGNGDNPEKPEYNYVKEADYISGASIMIKKWLWQELGGFDEMYMPAYCEDSDLCFKVRAKGYKVIYQPFSVVVHFEGVTHGTNTDKGIKKYQVINQKHLRERWHKEIGIKSRKGEHIFTERDRTTGKKHVLVVDHYLPQIDKDAGSRTISNFIDVMLELGYSVKFLGENSNTSPHYQKQFQLKGVEVLYGNQYSFPARNWQHYLGLNLKNFDAVLLSRSSVCKPLLAYLKQHNYEGKIIYYGHDLGYLRLEKEGVAKGDDSLLKLAKKIKADEDFMYDNATDSLAISAEEIAYLGRYINKPVHYVPPYFFDTEKETIPYEGRSGILFVGGFNHPPNQDAMRWFLDKVYETLERQNIYLTIVGSKMPDFIYKYKERFTSLNILPDASVEELNALYETTKIAIVPLLSGAGVKGKVIEAMSMGVPVVGTDIAFEGMPKDDNFGYRGVNTSADMLREIVSVYTDRSYWEKLSAFGKSYVSTNFKKKT